MESLREYHMYFPAAATSSLSDPAKCATLPRRKHAYLGETVQLLLVLRFRDDRAGASPWRELAGSLSALASACVAESRGEPPDPDSSSGSGSGEEPGEGECGTADTRDARADCDRGFARCDPLLIHNSSASGGRDPVEMFCLLNFVLQNGFRLESAAGALRDLEPDPVLLSVCLFAHRRHQLYTLLQSALVLDDQVIFYLTVSLDKLPVNTLKAKIIVTVWKEEEKVEVMEHGYLTLLQLRSPTHTFRQDQSTFKIQVNSTLSVLPPPMVQCQQMTVSGKHLTVLKVVNCSSQEEVCVRDVKILPNYNSSFLPMMPDGSVLVVDNVCHRSAEVTMASFYRVDSESSRLPSTLSALEEQNFLFQLQLQNTAEEDSSEGLEVPLVAVLQWYTPALPLTRYICSCYLLPRIRLARPQLVMTASCPSAVRPLEHFWVKYTLLNNLQDFMAVRLIWNSEAHSRPCRQDPRAGAVVCRSPLNHLGQCRKGSTISFAVAFQILGTGLFELSQHMKLKLQFTASVSAPPVGPCSPLSPRELLETKSLGRSQSFSHQQSSRPHHVRSGSVMESRAVAPPVGPPTGRAFHPPPDHTLISLDKIAKRECKVLVLGSLRQAHCR